jgi:PAS domain S-box-containing protein
MDPTDSSPLQRALSAGEAEFRELADYAPVLIWRAGTDQLCDWFNKPWLDFVGRTMEQEVGFGWAENVHPDDYERCVGIYVDAFDARQPFSMEYRMRRNDGDYRWLLDNGAPFHRDGTFAGYFGSCIDVHDQHLSEEISRLNEHRHRMLIETLPQLVWTCLPDGFCDYLSPQWINYTGIPMEEQLGMTWISRVIHPDDAERTTEHWMGAVAGRHPYDIEYRIRRYDGVFRWFKTRGTPIRSEDGTIAYWFGTCTDVQEFVEARHALSRSQDELGEQVAREVSGRLKTEEALRQSQKMDAIGQLTGGVAHDFNNLLTVIRGSVDLLRREDQTLEKRRRYVEAIGETADRAAKLTGQLLAFARRQALKPELFDVAESVRTLSEMMETLTGSGMSLDVQLSPELCHVRADRSQFDTSLVNMALNARDAMRGKGTLTIAMGPVSGIPAIRERPAVSGDFVAITVSDTGTGIDAENLQRIFEPFFTTKKVGEGTGLGLSQAIGFSRQSGGDIRVDSAPGVGTIFTLYLPRAFKPDDTAIPDPAFDGENDGEGFCVLIVEDNRDVGEFATEALRELGYDTRLTTNGNDALAALASAPESYDIVFSDVVMPGINGLELAQEIRRLHPKLPVLLTSGYSHVLAQNGTYGFELLHKPYSIQQLSGVLSKVLRWRAARNEGS